MTPVLEITERIRLRRDVNIVVAPGAEKRGNGSAWGQIECHVNHHTAGGNNIYIDQNLISGVPGLSGPLCNWCIMYDGDLGLVAAFPANHAGASGGWDTPPAPTTRDFNRRSLGTEIQYRGVEPMSEPQYRTMCILNYEINRFFNWPDNYIRCKNHQGTSIQGKWDPGYAEGKTYDIAQQRRDFARLGAPGAGAIGENEDSDDWKFILGEFMGRF